MANPRYTADAILTPVVRYLLVDCQTPFNGLSRTPVPLTPLHPGNIGHILSFAQSSPQSSIRDFVHAETGIHIASGEIGHLLHPETLEGYAKLFYDLNIELANLRRNGPSESRNMEIAKSAYIVSVWEAFLAQKIGKNALPYDGEIAAASEVNGTIRIASSMGGEIRSQEPFEIMLFQVLGRERKNGEIYPVETLALELADKIKGEGAEDFFKKFQNIQ